MQKDTAGVRHLTDLRTAGLTHVHLLPSYDYGSVPERAEDQQTPEASLNLALLFYLLLFRSYNTEGCEATANLSQPDVFPDLAYVYLQDSWDVYF